MCDNVKNEVVYILIYNFNIGFYIIKNTLHQRVFEVIKHRTKKSLLLSAFHLLLSQNNLYANLDITFHALITSSSVCSIPPQAIRKTILPPNFVCIIKQSPVCFNSFKNNLCSASLRFFKRKQINLYLVQLNFPIFFYIQYLFEHVFVYHLHQNVVKQTIISMP